MKSLKTIRIVLATVIFVLITLFFCDFTHRLPSQLHGLMHLQFIPAILSGSLIIVFALLLITFLSGRVYCSVICPLGILQDIIARFTGRGQKKNRKKRWYHYHKPYTTVRYSLLGISIICLITGTASLMVVTDLLDPYSNFGRIAANIFRPIVMEGNNVLNWIALQFHNYSFYQVSITTVTTASFVIALIALLTVGILSILRGRLFCNTICPIGSFLGLISRYSVFRITVNHSTCTHCGVCARACKAECIDSRNGKVDGSRCVACFNCLDHCNVNALKYTFAYRKKTDTATIKKPDKGRRSFIATSAAIAATAPLIPAWAQDKKTIDVTKLTPVTPPGSRSLKHFTEKCTACHLCVTHCPMQILKPAGFTFGLGYAFKPHLVYSTEHFCNYECTVCSKICPTGAIEKLDVPEKKVTQIGIAQFERSRCIVFTDHNSCGACSEHCPVQAVRMEAYEDGLTIPHVYEELCIGCGGCESICPVRPVKAINILASAVHQTAERPPEEETQQEKAEDLDFGF